MLYGRYVTLGDALAVAVQIASETWKDFVVYHADEVAALVFAGGETLELVPGQVEVPEDARMPRHGVEEHLIDLDALGAE